ncbi:hypothetical protein DNK47_02765 [Mycoplasma wenyonii]|uniref:Uncharacterized protein n=1 Tax=Mycoplasma wenyonii TaxID=65123 RepID=A0A328PMA8_9MOLU|nr:hypothetical protein [Mycoplasma wenyonii]RAO94865.1 hypothetical protein DNK47_02765 [Mycoplasma wenyonii]
MLVLLGAIGGFISLTAIVTGVSVTIANAVKSSGATQSQIEEKFEPIEKKECTVFLTSKDDSHTIVSCKNDANTWYLFNKNKNSLEKIEGISTPHNRDTELGYSLDLWKNRSWTAFKKYTRNNWRGSEPITGSFQISYKGGATVFPFFEYIKMICPPPLGVSVTSNSSYKCTSRQSLDIPTFKFNEDSGKQIQQKNTFNNSGDQRCYGKDNKGRWKTINCSTQISS